MQLYGAADLSTCASVLEIVVDRCQMERDIIVTQLEVLRVNSYHSEHTAATRLSTGTMRSITASNILSRMASGNELMGASGEERAGDVADPLEPRS